MGCNLFDATIAIIAIGLFTHILADGQNDEEDLSAYNTAQDHLTNTNESPSAPQRELRLEDFFWSGSGDGPPEFLKKVHSAPKDGKEVIIKTETLIATVYVEGQNDDDMLCLDCTRNPNSLPSNYTTDRRYWLLTVVAGFLRPGDLPLLEGNLAKLYRIAFTRQQSLHLGITNNFLENKTETSRRRRRNAKVFSVRGSLRAKRDSVPNFDETTDFPEEDEESESGPRTNTSGSNKLSSIRHHPIDDDVRILIHNVTLITEEDIQNWDTNYDDLNDQRNMRPMANQTEIIYSVFVNGKPVLATTAAEDMKLVTEAEVMSIIKKDIYMKAEPYLKEPQATPLVPGNKADASIIYNMFTSNPVMIAIGSIVILLLILLLVALLLMTRAKRQRSAEVKRLSSRQGLLSHRSDIDDMGTARTTTDAATSRIDLVDGIENRGFVYDHPVSRRKEAPSRKRVECPSIDFPLPPPAERPDSTSTASTSDSSVYCPINKPDVDLRTMLDDKAQKLFDKKKRIPASDSHERPSNIYTEAVKKRDKRSGKTKTKRKYLAENRVGSLEETAAQVHSSQEDSFSTDSISDSLKPDFDHFEHNEAINPNANYHRNKLRENRIFTDKIYETVDHQSMNQAINREIIRVLEHGDAERTSESGSIGSFLSMASIKSFPKQQLPEPLHRVLEPVSVTHYDYYDNVAASLSGRMPPRKPRPGGGKTVTLVDSVRHSQSDNPDPGVIGPIVWDKHRQRLADRNESIAESPVRDPASTRNRFEGLLEGAIQMYTADGETNVSPMKKVTGPAVPARRKDNRGKSAILPGVNRLLRSNSESRPVTAGPSKSHSNNSTQPPTPNGKAWGSGAPSPLVRPLSAGPFHCPEAPIVDVTRVLAHQSTDRSQISAEPLIEAIQNELKKFKRENSK